MPLVIAEAFRGCRSGGSASRSTTARSPRASTSGIGLDRRGRHAAHRRPARQDRARPRSATLLVEAGRDARAGRPVLALAAIRHRRPVVRRRGARARRPAPDPRRGARRAVRGHRGRAWSRRPACSSPTCRSRAASTTTPAPSTRPSSSGTSRGARSAPAAATTRSPPTAARPTPASASRSASRACSCSCSSAKRGLTAQPLDPGGRARGRRTTRRAARGSRAWPTALRARGIPCEVAPSAAKFGKQIRYADRRGIPYVWFPGAGDGGGDQVKDIRSGDQVDADAGHLACPRSRTCAPPSSRRSGVAGRRRWRSRR